MPNPLDNPAVLFDFRTNMMLNDIKGDIHDAISPSQVDWSMANKNTLACLRNLDEAIGDLNRVTEENLKKAGLT